MIHYSTILKKNFDCWLCCCNAEFTAAWKMLIQQGPERKLMKLWPGVLTVDMCTVAPLAFLLFYSTIFTCNTGLDPPGY